MSDEIHVATASGQSGSPTLPSEGRINPPQTCTHGANTREFAVSSAWEAWKMPRAALGGSDHPG